MERTHEQDEQWPRCEYYKKERGATDLDKYQYSRSGRWLPGRTSVLSWLRTFVNMFCLNVMRCSEEE